MDPKGAVDWIEGDGGVTTSELIRRRRFHDLCGASMIAMGLPALA
jgi:hypothetical protein